MIRPIGTFVILLTSLTMGRVAEASDVQGYSALGCVEEQDLRAEVYYEGGNALNDDSNKPTRLHCPIVRPHASDWSDIQGVTVGVTDLSASDDLTCFVRSCNGLGTSCENSESVSSSGVGRMEIRLESIRGFDSGYAYLVCSVPAKLGTENRSGILGYEVIHR